MNSAFLFRRDPRGFKNLIDSYLKGFLSVDLDCLIYEPPAILVLDLLGYMQASLFFNLLYNSIYVTLLILCSPLLFPIGISVCFVKIFEKFRALFFLTFLQIFFPSIFSPTKYWKVTSFSISLLFSHSLSNQTSPE